MDNILVSICVMAYNHELYLSRAIDSFLEQQCNFEYEIIIHDDASTDTTCKIIMDYYSRFPNIIVPFIEKENIYSKGHDILSAFNSKIRGRYVAFCEGDDYWCNSDKLSMQVKVLEENKDIIACVHNTLAFNDHNDSMHPLNIYDTDKTILDVERIIKWELKYSFHLSSLMIKKEILKNLPDFYFKSPVGDYPLALYISSLGKIFYIPETMSMYREFALNGWTERTMLDLNKTIDTFSKLIIMLKQFNIYTNKMYTKQIEKKCKYYKKYILMAKFGHKEFKLTIKENILVLFWKVQRKFKLYLKIEN